MSVAAFMSSCILCCTGLGFVGGPRKFDWEVVALHFTGGDDVSTCLNMEDSGNSLGLLESNLVR